MEPYEGPLQAAKEMLDSANTMSGKVAPRAVFDLSHGAIHNFVEAASKFEGVRGRMRHAGVWQRARELGFPVDLVKSIKTVEDRRGIVYGAVVTEEDARRALETANRLARLVRERGIAPRATGPPPRPSRPARSLRPSGRAGRPTRSGSRKRA